MKFSTRIDLCDVFQNISLCAKKISRLNIQKIYNQGVSFDRMFLIKR